MREKWRAKREEWRGWGSGRHALEPGAIRRATSPSTNIARRTLRSSTRRQTASFRDYLEGCGSAKDRSEFDQFHDRAPQPPACHRAAAGPPPRLGY